MQVPAFCIGVPQNVKARLHNSSGFDFQLVPGAQHVWILPRLHRPMLLFEKKWKPCYKGKSELFWRRREEQQYYFHLCCYLEQDVSSPPMMTSRQHRRRRNPGLLAKKTKADLSIEAENRCGRGGWEQLEL